MEELHENLTKGNLTLEQLLSSNATFDNVKMYEFV